MARGHKFDPASIARLEDADRIKMFRPELLWKTFDVSPTVTLLDVGAGTGVFARIFGKHLTSGRIFACDVSQPMLDYLKKSLTESDATKIVPILSEESAIPLPDASVDLAYSINVYHELSNARATLDEIRRILVPGGKIAIVDWKNEETPNGPPLDHRVASDIIFNEVASAGFGDITWINDLPQHQFLTARRIR